MAWSQHASPLNRERPCGRQSRAWSGVAPSSTGCIYGTRVLGSIEQKQARFLAHRGPHRGQCE